MVMGRIHHVQQLILSRRNQDGHVPRSMPIGGNQLDAVEDTVSGGHLLPTRGQGQKGGAGAFRHTRTHRLRSRHPGQVQLIRCPEIVFHPVHKQFGIWKHRCLEICCQQAPDVVAMGMGQDDSRYIGSLNPGSFEMLQQTPARCSIVHPASGVHHHQTPTDPEHQNVKGDLHHTRVDPSVIQNRRHFFAWQTDSKRTLLNGHRKTAIIHRKGLNGTHIKPVIGRLIPPQRYG
ncbi:MAG: hypothetical protein BWY82_02955 [Verrucomicrobia bacterium ADurb.Bin474]|nr:MAG: hypothetical protein BWY82_02955 [Verrucomicrobia bacterium ADurb.Bin474]